jgi:hypothetical protein
MTPPFFFARKSSYFAEKKNKLLKTKSKICRIRLTSTTYKLYY